MAKQNKVQQAEQITVKRSEVHAAPYNPRKITPEAAKLLKDNLKRVGLLGGIVWNRTTGNLVSGHQKMAQMDAINRYDPDNPETDYEFRVEVVDFDEKTEKEQNLFMNNRNAQGEYDDDMLRKMLTGIDFNYAGFDDFDMEVLGLTDTQDLTNAYSDTQWRESQITGTGYEAAEDAVVNEEKAKMSQEFKDAEENKKLDREKNFYEDTPENQLARHAEIQKIKDRIINQNSADKDGGLLSYVTISFKSPTERKVFLDMFNYPLDTRYINGEEFIGKLEFGDDYEEDAE
jgi:hypothetical protein